MRRVVTLLACPAVLTFAGCAGGLEVPSAPGNPAVYQRIATLDTCSALQHEFDTTTLSANARQRDDALLPVSIAYAEYAHQRMTSLHCE